MNDYGMEYADMENWFDDDQYEDAYAYEDEDEDEDEMYDEDDDLDGDAASALASAGYGTDEDYGDYGDNFAEDDWYNVM
jgi:hypothetical protein